MVLSIYSSFTLAIVFLAIIYMFFHFIKSNETSSIVIRLICSFANFAIETFIMMPIEISVNMFNASSIFDIIMWIVIVVITSIELGRNLTAKKETSA